VFTERTGSLIGTMLGKDYRVLEQIGAGGMAVVYLVEHQTLLKRFAAKVLSPELASSMEARARFTQEAHAASQLDHENIVSISDFGITADQRPFFVMELLRGQTLDQRLGGGPMSIEEVVAVSVPVARALAHAHAEGIIHRDIKPENIFLVQRSQGRWGVKVVDFGIAKTPLTPKLTQTKPKLGETLGSPLFMAPEMIRGEEELVDRRTDVYSFGVLLYLMLCGRLPFDDENLLKVMQMHLVMPVPPPREVNPALSPELAAVALCALAKRREDRYPSMEALLLELEATLPPGSDRLLIEAQSGTTLGETPFAAALSVQRQDSQRTPKLTPSLLMRQDSQRTIRVSPLPAPSELPPAVWASPQRGPSAESRAATLRSLTPRRLAIVVSSALLTGLLGAIAWTRITERHAPALTAAPSSDEAPPAAPPPATPAAQASSEVAHPPAVTAAPGADPAGAAAEPPATEPPATEPELAATPASTIRKQPLRPRPLIRREPPRPGKRVALATAPAAPAAPVVRGGTSAASPAPEGETAPVAVPGSPDPGGERAPAAPAPAPQPPAPAPAPAPAPVAPRPVSPAGPGSLDATPEVATLDVKGSLSPSVVRRGVERQFASLRACYQAAARAGQATPSIDLRVTFEIDENSIVTHVNAGGTSFGSLARCATSAIGQIRTQEAPDVGIAQVSVIIRFRPS
jgi:serine/threonine-protein kinase